MRQLTRRSLLLAGTAWLAAACTAAPSVEVDPAAYNFGAIPATAPVSATVQVVNRGRGMLRLGAVRTSCGCTQATLDAAELRSGAATNLTITFDPQAHPGLYGPLLRLVYLSTNDPQQPELEIPVHVEILAPEENNEEK
jgi:hypothetical protein